MNDEEMNKEIAKVIEDMMESKKARRSPDLLSWLTIYVALALVFYVSVK